MNEESTMRLKLERYKLKEEEDEELSEEEITEKEELTLNLNDLKERLSNAEDNMSFCQSKHQEVMLSNPNIFDIDTEIIYQKTYETV